MSRAGRAAPLVIGHRGASGYRPEHTAAAYQLAFAQGADAVEPDVVLSKDGVAVVRHENEISGTTDVAAHPEFAARRTTKEVDGVPTTGWFTEDFTWPELQTLRARERLPAIRPASAGFDGQFGLLRLTDVLRLAEEADAAAVVEVKHASYFDAAGFATAEIVAAEIAAAGWGGRDGDRRERTGRDEWTGRRERTGRDAGAGRGEWVDRGGRDLGSGRLVVESFEMTVLRALRASGLPAHYVYLLEVEGSPFDAIVQHGAGAPSYASQLTDAGLRALAAEVDGISVDKAILLPRDERGAALPASDIVDRAHAAGLHVFTWTLRAENEFLPTNLRSGGDPATFGDWEREFAAVFAAGVDGVFADQPDLAVIARRSVGGAA
ncbi:glycerophosphodiester phosphodiesterase family protein [Herbiconiux sp. 11R-BC]|uniref:glycerophosphodiester phosphodiesterase family protein n=1 Tax=Herbiconiux sp. 11R-BC TaxID=3111637 RepID=UPI003C09D3A7